MIKRAGESVKRVPFGFDAHTDVLWAARTQGRDWGVRSEAGQVDRVRLAAGGVDAAIFALFSDPEMGEHQSLVQALAMIADFERVRGEHPEAVHLVRTAADFERPGLKVLLSLEGGEALCGSPAVLETFYRLGVRALGLTWNHRNRLADGADEADTGGGLTAFGWEVVHFMLAHGMMIDVSHLSPSGFWDLLEKTGGGPIIASHSNARALCDHRRNLTDAQIKALAEIGGVIGLNFYPAFLRREGAATALDLIRHAEHIAEVGGIAAVGLGTDFDGISATPLELPSVEQLPRFRAALEARGWREDDVAALMGGNFKRVFTAVLPD
ncbi:MAG TPA: dipeptidase [Limnochordia bacterium]|nr:dipeptidase [Limnochordia bacterium]